MNDPAILKKNRKILVDKMTSDYGYLFCQKHDCGKSKAYKFEVHHIIFRSERPGHPKLHSLENLIIVCDKCHKDFHNKKHLRNRLLKERNLTSIFNIKPI